MYLVINPMGPVVPEAGKVDRFDEISLDALRNGTDFNAQRLKINNEISTIQKPWRNEGNNQRSFKAQNERERSPFMNDAMASAATKMGMTAATRTDLRRYKNPSLTEKEKHAETHLRLGNIHPQKQESKEPEEVIYPRMQPNRPIAECRRSSTSVRLQDASTVTHQMRQNAAVQMAKNGALTRLLAMTYGPGPYSPLFRSRTNTWRSSRNAGIPATDMNPRNATEKKWIDRRSFWR